MLELCMKIVLSSYIQFVFSLTGDTYSADFQWCSGKQNICSREVCLVFPTHTLDMLSWQWSLFSPISVWCSKHCFNQVHAAYSSCKKLLYKGAQSLGSGTPVNHCLIIAAVSVHTVFSTFGCMSHIALGSLLKIIHILWLVTQMFLYHIK